MSDNCPVCESPLIDDHGQYPPKTGERRYFDCPRCGAYTLSRSLSDDLSSILKGDSKKISVLSHSIRKMQRSSALPYIDSYSIIQILQNPPPSLSEQINNIILWLGQKTSPGQAEWLGPSTHQSIMGAVTPDGFSLVIRHLFDMRLLDGQISAGIDGIVQADASLTFDGWNYFDNLNHGAMASRKAFMAMGYGDPNIDHIVNEYFRPAVAATGFELYRLDGLWCINQKVGTIRLLRVKS